MLDTLGTECVTDGDVEVRRHLLLPHPLSSPAFIAGASIERAC